VEIKLCRRHRFPSVAVHGLFGDGDVLGLPLRGDSRTSAQDYVRRKEAPAEAEGAMIDRGTATGRPAPFPERPPPW
jgi:hypothetical protein